MPGIRRSVKVFLFSVAVVILILFASVLTLRIYAGNIAVYLAEKYTGYDIGYSEFSELSFNRVIIENLSIYMPEAGLTLNAEKAALTIDTELLIKKHEVSLLCDLDGVTFDLSGSSSGDDSFIFSNGILNLPVAIDSEYGDVSFRFFNNEKIMKVSGFKAYFKDIRLNGLYSFYKENKESSIDITVSVSPDIADTLESEIRDSVLSLEDNGWYSTVINYKGSTVLLKAIYSLSVS